MFLKKIIIFLSVAFLFLAPTTFAGDQNSEKDLLIDLGQEPEQNICRNPHCEKFFLCLIFIAKAGLDFGSIYTARNQQKLTESLMTEVTNACDPKDSICIVNRDHLISFGNTSSLVNFPTMVFSAAALGLDICTLIKHVIVKKASAIKISTSAMPKISLSSSKVSLISAFIANGVLWYAAWNCTNNISTSVINLLDTTLLAGSHLLILDLLSLMPGYVVGCLILLKDK